MAGRMTTSGPFRPLSLEPLARGIRATPGAQDRGPTPGVLACKALPHLSMSDSPVRFVTAAALFDGHDAAINIMRRILQAKGAEVIHLGHDRSVVDIVDTAIQEDAQGIAISSYQGGHVEYFSYMVDLLKERGASHIQVFGGGGGTIVPDEIRELEAHGVAKIYAPEDGMRMGLEGMIEHMIGVADREGRRGKGEGEMHDSASGARGEDRGGGGLWRGRADRRASAVGGRGAKHGLWRWRPSDPLFPHPPCLFPHGASRGHHRNGRRGEVDADG